MSDNINLVGAASPGSPIQVIYEVDAATGNLTLTFKNEGGTTTYGSVTIEGLKHRALVDALSTIAQAIYPNSNTDIFRHRVVFNLKTNSGLVNIE